MLIDTHTHVQSEEFTHEQDELILRTVEKDIWMVNVGTTLETSKQAITLAEKHEDGVYATVGVHPAYLIDEKNPIEYNETSLRELAQSSPKVVAIGETGLDVYRLGSKTQEEVMKIQEPVFRSSITLARDLDVAVVVHARGTEQDPYGIYTDIIRILKEDRVARAVVHCFGGTVEQALMLAEMGYMIGVTGIVTFKNAHMTHDVVRAVPLENIVIETDAPYLAPEPYRGKRNEPAYVHYVAHKIAELKGVSQEKVASETTINARRLYVI